MLEKQEVAGPGKPWKDDSFHQTYESADSLRNKLLRIWKNDEKHKGMQVKIHFLSSKNQFVVKTRLHPDFETKKEKKFVEGKCVNSRTEPCHLVQVLEVVSSVRGEEDLESFATAIYENSKRLFFPSSFS